IRYSIPASERVRLNVYDATGKKVASLVDGEQPAGTHEATWDARTMGNASAASGVYFARLEAGNRVQTQRMVLLK
ncbi:MAG: T9SS type A sorting domain-containing protein, partial [Ignavibacteriales bacterium]|nr:T9SS type A sorting domain-containing protein [Ignavibacteriales bacterium]